VSTTLLQVEVRNAAPLLLSEQVPAQADEGARLTFQAEGSDPGAADTLTYAWDFGDGTAQVSGPLATHAYAEDGRYVVTLTLADGDGATLTQRREVLILNLPPVPASVGEQLARVGVPLTLTLQAADAAGEQDPLTWRKEAGPGELLPDGTFRWTPALAGESHTLHARVTDDEGGTAELFVSLRAEASQQPLTEVLDEASRCGCTGGGGSSLLGLLALCVLGRRGAARPPTRPRQGNVAA
jgi:large repetitive protein